MNIPKEIELKRLICDNCIYIGNIGKDCRGRIAYCHYKGCIISPDTACKNYKVSNGNN